MLSGLISNKSISSTSPRNPFTFPIFFCVCFCVVCALQDQNHHLIHHCTVQHCTVLHTQAFQSASEKPLQQTRTFSEISLGPVTSLGKKASESTISGAKESKASIIPPEVFCNCKKPVIYISRYLHVQTNQIHIRGARQGTTNRKHACAPAVSDTIPLGVSDKAPVG